METFQIPIRVIKLNPGGTLKDIFPNIPIVKKKNE